MLSRLACENEFQQGVCDKAWRGVNLAQNFVAVQRREAENFQKLTTDRADIGFIKAGAFFPIEKITWALTDARPLFGENA